MKKEFEDSLLWARSMDSSDPMNRYRDMFYLPEDPNTGAQHLYFCGNSLGLQPKTAREYVMAEMDDWARLGVDGHSRARHPWMPYHEFLTEAMAEVVGAKAEEVVVMNSLTVNLHLLMVSFYRPTPKRHKILIEYAAFPSDRYAVRSQLIFHGYNPETSLLELKPDKAEIVTTEHTLQYLEEHGEEIALVLLGGVNYYTGQAYDLDKITAKAREKGCAVGLDLAHAAGNLRLNLHETGPDFAAWCSYKYLNGGPGALAGAFVHERHARRFDMPRFAGWWGHDKSTRFKMGPEFVPMSGAEGWQLSNPPILPMATIRASLDIFKQAGMDALVNKSRQLTGYLDFLLRQLPTERIEIITPEDPGQRGCQLSIRARGGDKSLFDRLTAEGAVADWREPDVIRVAPVPLYNSFEDAFLFVEKLKSAMQ